MEPAREERDDHSRMGATVATSLDALEPTREQHVDR